MEESRIMNEEERQYELERQNAYLANIRRPDNGIATVFKIIAWLTLIGGIFYTIAICQDIKEDDLVTQVVVGNVVLYGALFIGVYSVAEVIQILHDIRRKLWQK